MNRLPALCVALCGFTQPHLTRVCPGLHLTVTICIYTAYGLIIMMLTVMVSKHNIILTLTVNVQI